MFKKFEVESMGSRSFRRRLSAVALPFRGNTTPFDRTIATLQSPPLSCKSVVFEYDYVDHDFQDEFAIFYSKSFKTYPSRCTRLHFFADKISKKTRLDFAKYKNYLGHIVLRPIDLQRMGCTILRAPITDPQRQFIHCRAPFVAHILGQELQIEAMPFIQQDTQVGACAQASLWMLGRYMSRRFGYRDFLPGEINQLAKSRMAMGRPLPAELGLNWVQMLDALQGMGLSALSYSATGMDKCSPHVEKAFPIDPAADDDKREKTVIGATEREACRHRISVYRKWFAGDSWNIRSCIGRNWPYLRSDGP
jgi:hypothetical protein